MLMHRELTSMENRDLDLITPVPHSLRSEKFTPLSERLTNSELLAGVLRLKELMGMSDFATYIESLVAVRLQDQVIWLITDREMHRSIVERNFLPQVKSAFGVACVRVISQA